MIEELLKPDELSMSSVKRVLTELDTLKGKDRDSALKSIAYDSTHRNRSTSISRIEFFGQYLFPPSIDQLLEVIEDSLDKTESLMLSIYALDFLSPYLNLKDYQKRRLVDICNRIIDEDVLSYDSNDNRGKLVGILEKYDSSIESINRIRSLAENEHEPSSFERFAKRRAHVMAKKSSITSDDMSYRLDDYEAFELPTSIEEIKRRVNYFEGYEASIEGYWRKYEHDTIEELSELVAESNTPKKHIDLFFDALLDDDISTHLFGRRMISNLYGNEVETNYIRNRLLTVLSDKSSEGRRFAILTLTDCSETEFIDIFRNFAYDEDSEVSITSASRLPTKSIFDIVSRDDHSGRGELLYTLSTKMLTDDEEEFYRNVLHEMLKGGHVDTMGRVGRGLIEWGNKDSLPKIIKILDLLDDPNNAEFMPNDSDDYIKRPKGLKKPLYVTGEYGETTLDWPKENLRKAIGAIVAHEPIEETSRYIITRPINDISDMMQYFTPKLKSKLFFEYMTQPQREQLLENLLRKYERITMPFMPASMIEEARRGGLETTARELTDIFMHVEDYDKVAKTIGSWNPTLLARILNNYDNDGQKELLSRFRPEIAGATEFMMDMTKEPVDEKPNIFSAYEILGFSSPDEVMEESDLIDAFTVKYDQLKTQIMKRDDQAKREYTKIILAYEVAKSDWKAREQRMQLDLLYHGDRAPWFLEDKRDEMEKIGGQETIETYMGYDEIQGRHVVSVLTYVDVSDFDHPEIDMLSKLLSQLPPTGVYATGYKPDIGKLVVQHFSGSGEVILAGIGEYEKNILESIEIFKKALGPRLSSKVRYN